MSNHNYSQYSNNKKNKTNDSRNVAQTANKPKVEVDRVSFVKDTVVSETDFVTTVSAPAEPTEIKMEYPKIETPETTKATSGVVFDCTKLNVRSDPSVDADILVVLNANSEVEIDLAKSTKDWFKIITTAGIDGYCMRKFIKVTM